MSGGVTKQLSLVVRTGSPCRPAEQSPAVQDEKLCSSLPGRRRLSVVRTCCLLSGCLVLAGAGPELQAQFRASEVQTAQSSESETVKAASPIVDEESPRVDAEVQQDSDEASDEAGASADDGQTPNKAGIRISKRTTYLTEPLDDDGFLDVIGALNQRYAAGVTAESNAAVSIWSIALPESLAPELMNGFYERLGIPMPADPAYVSLLAASKLENVPAGQNPRVFDQQGRPQGPWDEKGYPELARWVKLNAEPLKKLHLAIQKPRYFVPLHVQADAPAARVPAVSGMILPDIQSLRDFARLLQASAGYRLGQGDVNGAIQNAVDCVRLGTLARQQPTLISNLVGIAIEAIGMQTLNFIVQHGNLSKEQCETLIQQLDNLPESLHCLEVLSESERLMYVDSVTFLASGQQQEVSEMLDSLEMLDALSGGSVAGIGRLMTAGTVDWNVVLENGNEFYNRLVAAGKQTTVRRRRRAMRELNRSLEERQKKMSGAGAVVLNLLGGKKSRGEAMSTLLLALLAPALEQTMEAESRREARENVTRIGIALAAWHADKKQYPERLTELVPGYLKTISDDPYVGRSPIYRRTEDGFLVYCVGTDLKDDKGVSFSDGEDDVTFRIPMLLED